MGVVLGCPVVRVDLADDEEIAVLASGCFWSPQQKWALRRGVKEVIVGYTGGTTSPVSYRRVGDHTEAYMIRYDRTKITFADVLDIFFDDHRPTAIGSRQYRSAIFFASEEQRATADASKEARLAAGWHHAAYCAVEPLGKFYRAEDYHQNYLVKRQRRLGY